MCRSIHTLYNVEPAASEEEARAAALQYVRKISGYRKPSRANEARSSGRSTRSRDLVAAARRARDGGGAGPREHVHA